MRVYDCDDDEQFAELTRRLGEEHLLSRDLIQTFGPDTLSEAQNRGFSTVRR
jgi:hypothetical protein